MADLHAALSQHFGLTSFRPGQEPAIGHVLSGHDTLAVMPTGWGKSLIYQLAALMLPGTALIISPLVALMKDQADSLIRRGVSATFINSSLDAAEIARRLRAVAAGECMIVLVAPERLHNRAFVNTLRHLPISLITVDEAHCISQWGHDFRPDYLHIADVRQLLNTSSVEGPTAGVSNASRAPMLALTATATPRVQDDIVRRLGMSNAQRVVMGFDRPSLTFEVFSVLDAGTKQRFIRDFLSGDAPDAPGAGIIYTGTRGDAEEVARFIRNELRIDARHYNGSLDADTRTEVQDAFMAGDVPVVVATNAFGMGIDRPDVRFVLHYTMPNTLEAYYQEAGRAGRDGLPARAVLLFSPKDTALHQFFIENDAPSAQDLSDIHSCLSSLPEISLATIKDETGAEEIKIRVALEQLEVAGAIRRGPDGARGLMDIETTPLSERALQTIAEQVVERHRGKQEQLDRMVAYAETNGCRRRVILDHFGDRSTSDAPSCCDNCLTRAEAAEAAASAHAQAGQGGIAALTQAQRAALIVLDTLATLSWEIGKGKLVQVLKGSNSKDMTTAGYSRNRNFGKFAALYASEIESLIVQLVDSGHLKQVGSTRPTLKLTARGEAALKNRAPIDVHLRNMQPATAQRVKALKEAGGTVAFTEQLLMQGLTPEQIAAQRMLLPGTTYTHLSLLITMGRAKLDQVVPAEVQQQVRAAIEDVGSVEYLAPIKLGLPDTIDYGVIRCVVEAWKLERRTV